MSVLRAHVIEMIMWFIIIIIIIIFFFYKINQENL